MSFKIAPNPNIGYGLWSTVVYLDWYFSSRGDSAFHMLSNSHYCGLVEEKSYLDYFRDEVNMISNNYAC